MAPIVLEYTPAGGHAEIHTFTRDDDSALGDVLYLASNWLHDWNGVAIITLRNGRKVRVTR